MRRLLLISSTVLLLVVVTQFYLAAYGAFGDRDATSGFHAHEWVARIALPVFGILVIVAAVGSRLGRRVVWLSTVPLIVTVVQFLLFFVARAVGSDTYPGGASLAGAIVLGFHALFGLAALAATVTLVRVGWGVRRGATTASEPSAPVA